MENFNKSELFDIEIIILFRLIAFIIRTKIKSQI